MHNYDINDINIYSIIDKVDVSIYWKDLEGKYLGCNQYMLNVIGYEKREYVIGKTDFELSWSESAYELLDADKKAQENGKHVREEIVYLNNSVKPRYFLSTKNRLLDNNNEMIGIIGTSIDITYRKENEQLLIEQEVNIRYKKCIDELYRVTQKHQILFLNDKIGVNVAKSNEIIKLSKRENDILSLIALNKSPKEISFILGERKNINIAPATISAIINKRLYPKFNVYNISQLISKAKLLKMLPFDPIRESEYVS